MIKIVILLTVFFLLSDEPSSIKFPQHTVEKTHKESQQTQTVGHPCINSRTTPQRGFQLALYKQNSCEVLDSQRAARDSRLG